MYKKVIIKEVIEDLLQLRQKQYDELIETLIEKEYAEDILNNGNSNFWKELFGEAHKDEKVIWDEFVSDFDIPLIKLNKLLDQDEKNSEVIEIEKKMAIIHNKQYLTVKEFEQKYNVSKTSQQNYRCRIHDPLPYHQKVEGGKIVYIVKEVEQWLDNQHR
ncbi:MAG: hypothetical protein C0627_03810 [Sulfurimonas sp.]|jgi:hypothetical protein|nr:MAG: hypothetical protein C0627_03810 [Sulfurimonas sp.]